MTTVEIFDGKTLGYTANAKMAARDQLIVKHDVIARSAPDGNLVLVKRHCDKVCRRPPEGELNDR